MGLSDRSLSACHPYAVDVGGRTAASESGERELPTRCRPSSLRIRRPYAVVRTTEPGLPRWPASPHTQRRRRFVAEDQDLPGSLRGTKPPGCTRESVRLTSTRRIPQEGPDEAAAISTSESGASPPVRRAVPAAFLAEGALVIGRAPALTAWQVQSRPPSIAHCINFPEAACRPTMSNLTSPLNLSART